MSNVQLFDSLDLCVPDGNGTCVCVAFVKDLELDSLKRDCKALRKSRNYYLDKTQQLLQQISESEEERDKLVARINFRPG